MACNAALVDKEGAGSHRHEQVPTWGTNVKVRYVILCTISLALSTLGVLHAGDSESVQACDGAVPARTSVPLRPEPETRCHPPGNKLCEYYGRAEGCYQTAGSYLGNFATGLALADLSGDGVPDFIVASGNDKSPQALAVYYNQSPRPSAVPPHPSWYSSEFDHHMHLAVGDIDQDGDLDVAVAVNLDKSRKILAGGVKIYVNTGTGTAHTLNPVPITRDLDEQRRHGYSAMGVALGDVNGDGYLDLAVAEYGNGTDAHPGRVLIYRNRGKVARTPQEQFEEAPAWSSRPGNPRQPTSLLFADVNQDGWMDLAVAGAKVQVFYGAAPRGQNDIPLDPERPFRSDEVFPFSYGIDAGALGAGTELSLVVSAGCPPTNKGCGTGRFLLYRPAVSSSSIWSSETFNNGAKLLLADLTDDPGLELVGGHFTAERESGGIWLFAQDATGSYPKAPTMRLQPAAERLVPQAIAVENLRPEWSHKGPPASLTQRRRGTVITLPERRIHEVVRVRVNGVERSRGEYAWLPGENWVSLRESWADVALPEVQKQQVQVEYRPILHPDIVVANCNPAGGNFILWRQHK